MFIIVVCRGCTGLIFRDCVMGSERSRQKITNDCPPRGVHEKVLLVTLQKIYLGMTNIYFVWPL